MNFLREARILHAVGTSGIPRVYGVEQDWQYGYLIEEYLEGVSLSTLISEQGHLSQAMTVRYGIGICRLINVLHTARPCAVLHLDLQPKNLIIEHDMVKLIDFDRACFSAEAGEHDSRCGTVGFAAPELYTGAPLDERTDIYAIGAVLYYMLTGRHPGKCAAFPEGRTGWQLCRVIFSCLRRNPKRRYPSVARLCEALEGILKGLDKQVSFPKTGL